MPRKSKIVIEYTDEEEELQNAIKKVIDLYYEDARDDFFCDIADISRETPMCYEIFAKTLKKQAFYYLIVLTCKGSKEYVENVIKQLWNICKEDEEEG
jgi:hypothetical protein